MTDETFIEADGLVRTRVPKAAELIAQELRRKIVARELREGETLPSEGELVGHFQTSRATLREAMRILESQGLISIRRGQRTGAVVHLPTIEQASFHTALFLQVNNVTLAQIIDTWILFEPRYVAALAETRPVDLLRRLRRSLCTDKALIGKVVRLPDEDTVQFHRVLLSDDRNLVPSIFLGVLRHIMSHHLRSAMGTRRPPTLDRPFTRELHRDHEELLDLIEEGNSLAVEQLWRNHLQKSGDVYLGEFGADTIIALPT